MPVVRFTTLLLLGLRCIRAQYQQRTKAYMDLVFRSLPAPEAPPGPEPFFEGEEDRTGLQLWLDGPGARLVLQLRWQLPSEDAAVRRVRQEAPRGVLSRGVTASVISSALRSAGVAFLVGGHPNWGADMPSWTTIEGLLQSSAILRAAQGQTYVGIAAGRSFPRIDAIRCLAPGAVVSPNRTWRVRGVV